MGLYRYVNGHVLYTEDSPELDDQFMRSRIIRKHTCKNCGLSGYDVFDGDPCPSEHFQALDKLIEETYSGVEEAELIVRQAQANQREGV